MTDPAFAPGGPTCPDTCAADLSPGEKVVPLAVLGKHWAGDQSAPADWLDERGSMRRS